MKRFSLILTIVALALGMTQCRKPVIEPIAPVVSGGTITKTITFGTDDGGAKVNFDGNDLTKPKWEGNEYLHVFAGADAGSVSYIGTIGFKEYTDDIHKNATFEGQLVLPCGAPVIKFFYFGENVQPNSGAFTCDFSDQTTEGGVINVQKRLMMECTNPDKNGENSYSGTLSPMFAVMDLNVTSWTNGIATIKKLDGSDVCNKITVNSNGTVEYGPSTSKETTGTGITYNVADHIIAIPPMASSSKGDAVLTISRGTQMAQIKVAESVITKAARVKDSEVSYKDFNQQGDVYVNTTHVGNDNTQIKIEPVDIGGGTQSSPFTPIKAVRNVRTSQEYETLEAALEGIQTNDELMLLTNLILTKTVETTDKTFHLNLNGFGVSYETGFTGNYLFQVNRGGHMIIDGQGVIAANTKDASAPSYGIMMTKSGETQVGNSASLTVNGGTIKAFYSAVLGNGSEGRENTNITINGGLLEATGGLAIYHPQDGVLTINGGIIKGVDSAVELRAGDITVNGGTLISTKTTATEWQGNTSGTTTSGAALAIAQHTTQLDINVVINGGDFVGPSAVYEHDPQSVTPKNVTMSVSGGTFTKTVEDAVCYPIYSHECTGFIKGGTYNTNPTADYIATGHEAVDNGNDTWTVKEKTGTEVTPETVQAALDAATEGTIITLTSGDYGVLYLRNNGSDDNRIFKDVVIKAASGANVNVQQIAYQKVNNKYLDIENLIINRITFNDPEKSAVLFDVDGGHSIRVNGLTIQNCKKTGNKSEGTTYDNAAFVGLYYDGETAIGAQYAGDQTLTCGYHNIVVKDNQIEKVLQPVKIPNAGPLYGMTITGNTFDDCYDNHMMLSSKTTGNIIIENNTIKNMTGRFARIAGAHANAVFTISGNTVVDPQKYDTGGDGSIFKITGTAGFTVKESNNEWQAGSFNEANDTWIAYGAVAKVGSTYYTTLAEAIAAVPTGSSSLGQTTTIELIANIGTSEAYAEYATAAANTINGGRDIILDLNGHQIYAKTTVNGYSCYILVANDSKLTVKDSQTNGAIYYIDANDNTGGIAISCEGELVLQSGHIENKTNGVNSSIQGAVDIHANEWGSTYYTKDTKFTMTGGSLASNDDNTLRLYDSSQAGSGKVHLIANISGGTITGRDAVFVMPQWTTQYVVGGSTYYMNPIDVTVSGGTFTTTNGIRVAGGVGDTNNHSGEYSININVSGGAFTITDTQKYRYNNVAFQETTGWTSTEETTAKLRSYSSVTWTAAAPTVGK